ncbi:MAG: response regulator transcription factor [Anaerolineales bacterium]|jgi:DNA-binding NarL/FixJ family response regulator
MPDDINVLIVDDQQLVRDGISALLDLQEGISIVGSAGDGEEALEFIYSQEVDIVLMDIRMPVMNGIEATQKIKEKHPSIRVIMLTTFDDEEYIIQSLQAGACGYLLKDIPTQDLAQAVKLAHSGIFQLSSTALGKLVDEDLIRLPQSDNKDNRILSQLTEREIQILNLIATGASNNEIAEKLFISEGTVKNHVSRILAALQVRDRVQAAILALQNGLG